ncbi:MAG: PDZ domain-containing protein [Limisphaera sp.]|nr:PDZ domain-containing protein [Limisphaera sp.]
MSRWPAPRIAGCRFKALVCILAVGLLPTGCVTPARQPTLTQAQLNRVAAQLRPSLVRLRVVSTDYVDGREVKTQSVGSGVIITEDGYLITNHHVAGWATRIFCTLWNLEEVEAELVGTDALTDIAVVKLKPDRPMRFTPARLGDSSRLRVGDPVLAMGSPMALSQSVTLGIVSNTEMIMPRFMGPSARLRLDGEDVGSLVKWIGHDAPIFGGNSGGPLVNLQGEVVGINEMRLGLSGAIPINLAREIAQQLIAEGRVRRSWLGMDVQPRFKRSEASRGVLVAGVLPDSPAQQAGLQAGDLLVALAGRPVDVRFDEQIPEFMRLVCSLPIGQSVPCVVERAGREITLHVVPAERGEFLARPRELKAWGITARDLTPLSAREMKRPDTNGVVVTSVRAGGPAGDARPPLDEGDVLVAVNHQPVRCLADLVRHTEQLTQGRADPVPVLATFERGDKRFLTVVRLGITELEDPGREVTKAWLPVEVQVLTRPLAQQLGRPDLRGFYITRVYPRSTAARAGLQVGDLIVAVDGEPLTASSAEHADELGALVRQYDVGSTVTLTLLRNGQTLKVPVELVASPRLPREMKTYRNPDFEFTARDLSFFDRAEEQWPEDQTGVRVTEVRRGGWADLGMLLVDDLIVEVDGQPVTDVDSLRQRLEQAAAARRSPVIFKVLRGIHTRYLELEPKWDR